MPLWASFLTDASPGPELTLKLELVGHDDLGRFREWWKGERKVPFAPWTSRALEPVAVPMPDRRAVAVLRARLEDAAGRVLHRNFTAFVVGEGALAARRDGGRRRADAPRAARESRGAERRAVERAARGRRWTAASRTGPARGSSSTAWRGRRACGREDVAGASFLAELGAKELFGKDRPGAPAIEGDFMRGQGTHDPGRNPNAYPMTDADAVPERGARASSTASPAGVFDLPDDPADHRGLRLVARAEAGREAETRPARTATLVSATRPGGGPRARPRRQGEFVVRLEVDEALPGGLAVYGEGAGRYPLDPSLVLTLRR